MGERTAISWTDHTFNPWWGCERVSPGCQHCYAEAFAKRTGNAVWGKSADRRFFGDKHWAEPLKWDHAAEKAGRPARVFCASMADVFEDRPDLVEHRSRLLDLIDATPHLIWQLLTKRPQNVLRLPVKWLEGVVGAYEPGIPPNVWIGTTVEDQQRANERIPILADIPATVRFLSCEPLLGSVDITLGYPLSVSGIAEPGIDWVIAGGESGPGHRPLNVTYARVLRNQCAALSIPFFFKQIGGRTPTAGGHLLDGREHHEFPRQWQEAT